MSSRSHAIEVQPPALGLVEMARLLWNQGEIIFKGGASCGQAWASVQGYEGGELVELPTLTGQPIKALFGRALSSHGEATDSRSAPTVLFFYGNDMCLARSLEVFEVLRRCGANVLVPEYVGYGMSPGKASEANCYATADAAWDYLAQRGDIDGARIVAMGASLGGAVAVDLAARRPVAGLVTLITFSSLPELANCLAGLPVGMLVRHRFDSVKKMPRVKCPAVIAHSTGDELIPLAMADQLAAAAGGPVKRVTMEGVSHCCREMLEASRNTLLPALGEFLESIKRI